MTIKAQTGPGVEPRTYSYATISMIHILNGSERALCGVNVDPRDRYQTPEAGRRVWDRGVLTHCPVCERRAAV